MTCFSNFIFVYIIITIWCLMGRYCERKAGEKRHGFGELFWGLTGGSEESHGKLQLGK
jgi:hypothetical protein